MSGQADELQSALPRPLRSDSDLRVVAVMNFYTESCPESTGPAS